MKRLLLLTSFVLTSYFSNSQDFEYHHGVGVSYMFLNYDGSSIGNVAFTYSSRLGIINLSKNSSLSLNIQPSLALSINSETSFSRENSFAFELPISANYNIGHGATAKGRSSFGGFVGLGYGFNTMTYSSETSIGEFGGSGSSSGIYGEIGTRFKVHNKKMRQMRMKPASLGVSLYTIQGRDSNIYGLRIIYNLKAVKFR